MTGGEKEKHNGDTNERRGPGRGEKSQKRKTKAITKGSGEMLKGE